MECQNCDYYPILVQRFGGDPERLLLGDSRHRSYSNLRQQSSLANDFMWPKGDARQVWGRMTATDPKRPVTYLGLLSSYERKEQLGINMACLIAYTSSKFDPTKERVNPINPLQGETALHWLRDFVLTSQYESSKPQAEDWGWYIDVSDQHHRYIVGSIVTADVGECAGEEYEWLLQIERQRSLKERILGRSKLNRSDALVSLIVEAMRADSAISDVHVTDEA